MASDFLEATRVCFLRIFFGVSPRVPPMVASLSPLVSLELGRSCPDGHPGGSSGVLGGKDGGASQKSYMQALAHKNTQSGFKMPIRYPVEVDGELGFSFTKAEMNKAAEEYRFAMVLKFLHERPTIDVV